MRAVFRLLLLLLTGALTAAGQVGLVAAFHCNENAGTTITDITATNHVGTMSGAT